MTPLIGIGHRARVGKDTVAWLLIDALRARGIDARRYAFADALKTYCRVEHGMTAKDAPLLQRVGVALRDSRGADIWINILAAQIAEDAPAIAIIPDMRFPNELAWVQSHGGLAVCVTRPDPPDAGRDLAHISEVALADAPFDLTIANDGTLADLRAQVEALVTRVLR